MKASKLTLTAALAATTFAFGTTAVAVESWDMPMAYSATNFHSEIGVVFADRVRDYTGGEVDITLSKK